MTSVLRLESMVTLADLSVAPSDDGQCLFVLCREQVVAMVCVTGSDVDVFEFSDATRLEVGELLERLERR